MSKKIIEYEHLEYDKKKCECCGMEKTVHWVGRRGRFDADDIVDYNCTDERYGGLKPLRLTFKSGFNLYIYNKPEYIDAKIKEIGW